MKKETFLPQGHFHPNQDSDTWNTAGARGR